MSADAIRIKSKSTKLPRLREQLIDLWTRNILPIFKRKL